MNIKEIIQFSDMIGITKKLTRDFKQPLIPFISRGDLFKLYEKFTNLIHHFKIANYRITIR